MWGNRGKTSLIQLPRKGFGKWFWSPNALRSLQPSLIPRGVKCCCFVKSCCLSDKRPSCHYRLVSWHKGHDSLTYKPYFHSIVMQIFSEPLKCHQKSELGVFPSTCLEQINQAMKTVISSGADEISAVINKVLTKRLHQTFLLSIILTDIIIEKKNIVIYFYLSLFKVKMTYSIAFNFHLFPLTFNK